MLEKLIAWSVNNKFIVILLTAGALAAGIWSVFNTPVDALPDLSDVQVIVYTDYQGQSPVTVEDQVTYPLTTALVSVPGSKTVRGYSFFGYSLVYVLFEDGTDPYWARSRVLEYLNTAQKRLPAGIVPTLGPDASGVGWVFQYTLTSPTRSLAELRTLQDWFLKYELASVDGVADVASVGGFVKQYQVTVDPLRLASYKITLQMVEMAIMKSNQDAGGETLELGETEFMIRGLGYLKSEEDIRAIPVMTDEMSGTPVFLKDIADVTTGPEMRRGLMEWNGEGEAVGGIVVMRHGQNALKTIDGVKKKLAEIRAGLPSDVTIETGYDRSDLILRAIDTLREKLLEEILIVGLISILFLLHARSALVAIFTLPTAILMAFIVMKWQGLNANIMSLGGIAIAIGAMVDAAIILIENTHKHLEQEAEKPESERRDHWTVVLDASKEVGPTLFWSLAVITVSFLPVFALEAESGRLFHPLAFTKTYSMAAATILSVTIIPVLMGYFIRGKILPEHKNPVNRFLINLYRPVMHFSLKKPVSVIVAAVLLVVVTWIPLSKLGTEFMPPLWEGDILYMPTTLPGISITKAKELLQQTDKIIRSFPEVESVWGKAGRAETATDPAGLDMLETTIRLKPESDWRPGMTKEKLIAELNDAIQFPGLTNAWTLPIKTRIDMLSTGIKTPVGIKISGANPDSLQAIGQRVEAVIRTVPGTASAFAERAAGGNYFDISIRREDAARYGLSVADIQDVIRTAMGGMAVTTTVEGLERYPVSLRYSRDFRESPEALMQTLISTPSGAQIPLNLVAEYKLTKGPMVIRTEDTRPNSWVFVDLTTSDIGGYIEQAQKTISEKIQLPAGYSLLWSGEFEYIQRAEKRLMVVIPLTLLLIILILYLNTRSAVKTCIVLLAVPFSLIGAIWFLWILDYQMSVAVWIGLIALAGLDAETGVVMLLYLDRAFEKARQSGTMTIAGLKAAIDEGAVQRVRPKIMTAAVIIAGLLPILWSSGTGADVMKRIAAPMAGGVVTSVLLELLVYPAVYFLWRKRKIHS